MPPESVGALTPCARHDWPAAGPLCPYCQRERAEKAEAALARLAAERDALAAECEQLRQKLDY